MTNRKENALKGKTERKKCTKGANRKEKNVLSEGNRKGKFSLSKFANFKSEKFHFQSLQTESEKCTKGLQTESEKMHLSVCKPLV